MTKTDTKRKKDQARTKLAKAKFIESFFKLTGNISALCRLVGITRQTYYEWIKKDQEFQQAIENEHEGLVDFAESKMWNLINDKNPTMLIFFLKTQGKKRGYIESSEYIHSGGMILELSDKFLPKPGKDGKTESE